jgi:hypothetical protein
MEVEKERNPNQQKSEDSKKLLRKLREQLLSSNGSIRRQAGFNLSWLQEDGLEVLKDALFGDSPVTTKNAAAYGLRKMHGRMKKMALEVFKQGREHQQSSIREVCTRALILLGEITPEKTSRKRTVGKLKIREIPKKAGPRRRVSAQSRNQRPLRK